MSDVYKYTGISDRGITLADCGRALEALGIEYEAIRFHTVAQIPKKVPVLAVLREKDNLHAVAAIVGEKGSVLIFDGEKQLTLTHREFDAMGENVALVTGK